MKVVFSTAARSDLAGIEDYIAEDNARRARSFVDELIDRAEELADMPRAFPLVPRYESAGIRRRTHKGYLIIYLVRGDTIEVLHVIHGARDYERLLSRREDEG